MHVLFCSGEVCERSSWGGPAGKKDEVRSGQGLDPLQQVPESLAKLPGAAGLSGCGECCRVQCQSKVCWLYKCIVVVGSEAWWCSTSPMGWKGVKE